MSTHENPTNNAVLSSSPSLLQKLDSLKEILKESSLSNDDLLVHLNLIESCVEESSISRESFVQSKIGAVVKKVSETSAHPPSKAKAKLLLSKWRSMFSSSSSIPTTTLLKESDTTKKPKLEIIPTTLEADKNPPRLPAEEKRQKVVHLLKAIFSADSESATTNAILKVCVEMESVLHELPKEKFTQTYQLWKCQLPKNDELRRFLLLGEMECSELLTMTAQDMLPAATKLAQEKALFDIGEARRSDWIDANQDKILKNAGVTSTEGFFTCFRCHSKKTTFYQKQTRGADEPMTVFVQCLNCKNRWRTY